MGIALIILIFLIIFGPLIMNLLRRWLMAKARNKMEDYIRAASGMPPRDSHSGNNNTRQQKGNGNTRKSARRRKPQTPEWTGPIIPPEYAEDVEFTEIKSYSETTEINGVSRRGGKSKKNDQIRVQSQVEDAEWTEIKIKR